MDVDLLTKSLTVKEYKTYVRNMYLQKNMM